MERQIWKQMFFELNILKVVTMPITDVYKKRIAQEKRLYLKICRDCGARNSMNSLKCRKCRGKNLRPKKRVIGAK